jgi:hypothetical protein
MACALDEIVTTRAGATPDVVDQHVDPGEGVKDLVGKPSYLRLGRQVRDEHVDRAVGHRPAADLLHGSYSFGA